MEPLTLTQRIDDLEYNVSQLKDVFYKGNFAGSQSITKNTTVTSGYFQSGNFLAGSSGWRIDAQGNIEANTGTFRGTLSSATINSSTINSSTITGGTIRTASSGARIEITSANGVAVYNSDGTLIGQLQTTDSGTLLSSTSPNTASRMFQQISFIQNGSNSSAMINLQAADVSTGTVCLGITQNGDSAAISITNSSSSGGRAINIAYSGTAVEAVKIVNDTASVIGLNVSNTFVTSDAWVAQFINSGASATAGAVYAEGNVASIAPVQVKQATATSTNFYKILDMNGGGTVRTLWLSNTTDPNGALSGIAGDICFNCNNQTVKVCTVTGTTWAQV